MSLQSWSADGLLVPHRVSRDEVAALWSRGTHTSIPSPTRESGDTYLNSVADSEEWYVRRAVAGNRYVSPDC